MQIAHMGISQEPFCAEMKRRMPNARDTSRLNNELYNTCLSVATLLGKKRTKLAGDCRAHLMWLYGTIHRGDLTSYCNSLFQYNIMDWSLRNSYEWNNKVLQVFVVQPK